MARLLSINVGLPRDVAWRGEKVHTAIWKQPLRGRVAVHRLNVEGDGQGDLAGHGGEHRAVMVYQMDAYRYWEAQLGRKDAEGSRLFECITTLPEYFPTRTERDILANYAAPIITATGSDSCRPLRLLELGAGTAAKTGILLGAATRLRDEVIYIPVDVSSDALDEACDSTAFETIHTESSYKFTRKTLEALLDNARFTIEETWTDARQWYSLTLAGVR
jgi:uncharacterized SAM-dependent methyltransferase